MRVLKLTIAYDGTRYAGWQVQQSSKQHTAHSKQKPTIQGTLERVLRQVLQESVKVIGSGRTDAGVHALAQVAHVRTRSPMRGERLLHSLNQLLPPDVAVTHLEEVAASFHARFSARYKQYRYRIFTGPVVGPFLRPYVHHVRTALNLSLMRREATTLKGRHDFRGFAMRKGRVRPCHCAPQLSCESKKGGGTVEQEPSGGRDVGPPRGGGAGATGSARGAPQTVRTLSAVRLIRRGPEIQLELAGNGFLHTMVRSIAGTLLDIGRGRLPPGTIQRILRTGDRRLAGMTAPAKGLILVGVFYAAREDI